MEINKIKILYVGYSPNMGGIERFILNVCKYIDKEKFDINILIFKGNKACRQDELERQGVNFFEITNRKTSYKQYVEDLKKVYSENNFHIIHFNIMSFSCFERITLASKYSKARLIIHSHSGKINKVYRRTLFLDKIGRFAIKNISYEKIACGKEAGKWLFGNNKQFTILNNGMEVEQFQFTDENKKKIREELNIDYDTTVLGNIGRFSAQKNHKFLIDIFYEYQKLENNSKLILVGEGELQEQLQEQVNNLNLQDKVLFLGRRNDTEKIYSAMDVFIMPSWFEGLSIAIIEAQANGLKCYTSTNVARESNVIGNVEFLQLDKGSKYWAEKIYKNDNSRNKDAIKEIPKEFKIEETIKILSEIYKDRTYS